MPRRSISEVARVANRPAVRKYVSAGELAEYLGISARRVQQLAKEGMPRIGRGEYPLREAVRYYVEYLHRLLDENQNETIITEKIRLTRAKAKKAELEAEKAGGAVLDVEKVRHEVMVLAVALKEAFLSLPGRLAPALSGLETGEVKQKITEEITDTLNKVAEKLENYAGKTTADNGEDTKDCEV